MSYNVTIGQWNVGSDGDFFQKGSYQVKSEDELDQKIQEIATLRNEQLKTIFCKELSNSSILCLQEVGPDLDRIKSWLGKKYDSITDKSDTAIAWDKNRFKLLQSRTKGDRNEDQYNATIVSLQDKATGKIITVASTHLTGCCDETEAELKTGNQQLQQLVNESLFKSKADLTILGMDANVTPTASSRHAIVEHHGFTRDTSHDGEPTEVRGKHIDYLFGKSSRKVSITPITVEGHGLNNAHSLENPSDHTPVVQTFEIGPSVLERFIRKFQAFFRKIFNFLKSIFAGAPDRPTTQVGNELINFLQQDKQLQEEGIFRIPGDQAKIQKMFPRLKKGKVNATTLSVHDAAGMLKRWIKEQGFITELKEDPSEVLATMPEEKKALFQKVIQFLGDVAKADNKMNATNIARSLGGNFFTEQPIGNDLHAAVERSSKESTLIQRFVEEAVNKK